MKIVIVCKSHKLGGAAVVSHRLMNALRKAGHDARMLVLSSPSEQWVDNYSTGWRDKVNFIAERLQIFLSNGFSRKRLFQVDTAAWGADISEHEWVREADVVNLNWINQGALSLHSIEKLLATGKKIVWTMHDMWNCTGICHHAYQCTNYENNCGNCQYLGKMSADNDLSRRTHAKKQQLYAKGNITFVAVSNWLAQKCRKSSLMRCAKIVVIPNAFPIEQFPFLSRDASDLGVPNGRKVLIMGAARLDDDVKGFDKLIAVCRYLADNKPEVAAKCHLVLFGGIRNKNLLEQIAIPYTYLGSVDGKQVPQLYAKSDVVLSTSYYETLPGTLVEGLASGCVGVSFASGGQSDIIDHLETGYLAEAGNVSDFSRGVEWAVNESAVTREMLNRIAAKRFTAEVVAEKYINLFGEEL